MFKSIGNIHFVDIFSEFKHIYIIGDDEQFTVKTYILVD